VFQVCAIVHTLSLRQCCEESMCNRPAASTPLLQGSYLVAADTPLDATFHALSSVAFRAGDVVIALALRVILGLLARVCSAPCIICSAPCITGRGS
jgi:hypothetical protein